MFWLKTHCGFYLPSQHLLCHKTILVFCAMCSLVKSLNMKSTITKEVWQTKINQKQNGAKYGTFLKDCK